MDEIRTIAAIATAPGPAGVAIVRVSGPDAYAVASRVAERTIRPGLQFVRMALDECVVLGFVAPRSYTGEDVVEFQCHGGSVVPRRLLEALFSAGARLARRGEFTERAFLNGKLDYDQAESVLDLINAKTTRAAEVAREGLAGKRVKTFKSLYELALTLSSDLEHALDIDEGELPESFFSSALRSLDSLRSAIDAAIKSMREGKLLREGALVVLAGPPNAGKSSLMNALLCENRAIVSDVPGTTRDSIEEWTDICGYPIRLVDTAGLRETGDVIEAEGVKRAQDLISRADVILNLGADDLGGIKLHAKCDLGGEGEGLRVSAKTGEGLEALERAIVEALERARERAPTQDETALSTLLEVRETLSSVLVDDLVLAANDVRRAAERLGSLIGATYSSDLLDRLFSRFCVGK